MGINKFMIFLIVFTIIFLFIEKNQIIEEFRDVNKPKVSFDDSIMYEITDQKVKQVLKSKQADIYDNREELYDATIVIKDSKNKNDTNIVSGRTITKIGENLYLKGSVNLQLADGTNIKTEELYYNTITKIANNSVDFIAIRDNDTFNGNSLYLDSVMEKIKAEKTKFRMKVTNE
ncbi:MAG: LPS export ABC transporter protein LptC [Arcobacteraceae bacterium]|jgi:LPS export ABC transporter protein LptC